MAALSRLLQLMGHEVAAAHHGSIEVGEATRSRPDVVLLDIGLSEIDGFDVYRRLRHRPETCDAVVFAVTGYMQEDDRRRSLEAGFDAHLVKPVDLDSLQHLCLPVRPRASACLRTRQGLLKTGAARSVACEGCFLQTGRRVRVGFG